MDPKLMKLIAAATKWFSTDSAEHVSQDGEETNADGEVTKPVTSECSCSKSEGNGDKSTEPTATEEGGPTVSEAVKTLAARLIGLEKSPFKSECEETLLNFSEAQLESMIEQYEEPVLDDKQDDDEKSDAEPVTSGSKEDQVVITKEVYADMLATSQAFKAQRDAEKGRLIGLIAKNSDIFTSEELQAKDNDELTKLVTLVGAEPVLVPNLSQTDTESDDDAVPAPPSMKAAIDARRQGK